MIFEQQYTNPNLGLTERNFRALLHHLLKGEYDIQYSVIFREVFLCGLKSTHF